MKRTEKKAYERANKKDKVLGGVISFAVVVLVGALLISIFTAQHKRKTFDEQVVEQTSKKKISTEKRIERERSSVERIQRGDSLDTAESVREPVQSVEVQVSETSQTETTTEPEGNAMGSSWTQEDMQPKESSESKKEYSKENGELPKPVGGWGESKAKCEHEWVEETVRDDEYRWWKCSKCGKTEDEYDRKEVE